MRYKVVARSLTTILPFVSLKGAPGFAYHRAARTPPTAWGESLSDLRLEAAAGTDPIPYASRELRDKQAESIKTDEDLLEDQRARLLAHIARTPYLEEVSTKKP